MTTLAQHSATSLSRYASTRSHGDDVTGPPSRDFCNSFWGTGDDGVNALFSRMRGAIKTTDELRSFWNERATIEEQYAARLATLSKSVLGSDEVGDLRNSLDTLRSETEKQALAHLELAGAIRTGLEAPTSHIHAKQVNHRRNVQAAVEKKFKLKQSQESYTAKAREKYEGDCARIASYRQQSSQAQGKELERVQLKLKRAQQTVQANEKDFSNFAKILVDMLPGWEADWKEFCDSCQDLEEDRLDFMKDNLWTYANEVSTLCVSDDQSCERIRTVLDQLESDRDIENYILDYGTGNAIPEPPILVSYNGQDPQINSLPSTRPANFVRVSRRPAPVYRHSQVDLQNEQLEPTSDDVPTRGNGVNGYHETSSPISQTNQVWNDPGQQHGHINHGASYIQSQEETNLPGSHPPQGAPPTIPPPPVPELESVSSSPPHRPIQRQSQPLPTPGLHQQSRTHEAMPPPPPPPPQIHETGGILFYVKALYDYTATIEEEFDFQTGDVIAVTATPDDGWWSGELLDENRRVEGRHVFPSNFVCLF